MEHSQAVIKVTFVGAGSIEFTRNVVTDLCSYPELRGQLELALYDISAERLAYAERLARQLAAQSGAGARVTATQDRRAALAGADYVINEVQVGGYDATRADFDIPARYGVRQTIGDTLGIGGIFRGLRTIPVVLALAPGHARGMPGRLPAQLQQPDGHAALGGVRGHPAAPGVRAVPLGARHPGLPDRAGRRRPGPGPVPHRGLQPPGVRAPVRAGRRVPVPAADRGHRPVTGAAAPGPGGDLPPVRLLPDRVQRAFRRVRAVVHAARFDRSSGSASSSATTWRGPRRTCASWTRCRPTWTRARRST